AVGAFPIVYSSIVPLDATKDQVSLVDVNRSPPNGFSPPPLTQNDTDKPIARLTMAISSATGSAVWRGLKLDRWITAGENGGAPVYNKASDVKKISIWYDSTKNGLLETTGTVKDTEVLLIGAQNRTFPTDTIKSPVTAADDVIFMDNVQAYFPSDSPFPIQPPPEWPGRLVINDGQSDPALKEVIYYSSVNVLGNSFAGVTRGMEGTLARNWSTGTVVSGRAVLPLVGEGGSMDGQAIYTTEKDYFITYDVSPLATVNNAANLGLAIRNTDYFVIAGEKTMGDLNIGVTPPGKSVSLIGNVREYGDKVLVTSSNTLLAASLQQQAVNQPIISFTMAADVADAMWRYVLVYATGSVVAD
ncbi:MAG: hypothetical protein AABZ63_01705, partial [Actinomycetota bacterium]